MRKFINVVISLSFVLFSIVAQGKRTDINKHGISGAFEKIMLSELDIKGFSPEATGIENTKALQEALDQGGTIFVNHPGTYKMAGTVYIGSNTSLIFGNNVFLKKVDEQGAFSHVIVNKGAATKTYDELPLQIQAYAIIVSALSATKP
jgi:hypothetical protein